MSLRLSVLLIFGLGIGSSVQADVVLPGLVTNLVCYYDFDHPATSDASKETDLGFSGTELNLINGGAAMRTNDGAYAGSERSLQTQQLNPTANGDDDWKAGFYLTNGITSLNGFSAVAGITLMGWVKPTGSNPNLNSTTAITNDFYNAVGLFGLLSGNSEGHAVRALLEVIEVSGTLRLVALGRRTDGGSSLTLAATNDWRILIPSNTWTHLAATFDFDHGTMALYRNGELLPATYTTGGDPWGVVGGTEPDLTSASNPAGIKVGGSFPQNTQERNPFNGRFDDLMFFNRALDPAEVQLQFANFSQSAPPVLSVSESNRQLIVSWPATSADYVLERNTNLLSGDWAPAGAGPSTNGTTVQVTLPVNTGPEFFRLKKP